MYRNDDFITIVSNEEIIRIALFHIRNISYGVKVEKTKDDDKAKDRSMQSIKRQKFSKSKNDSKDSKNDSKKKVNNR